MFARLDRLASELLFPNVKTIQLNQYLFYNIEATKDDNDLIVKVSECEKSQKQRQ
jgi:hypothetical protein